MLIDTSFSALQKQLGGSANQFVQQVENASMFKATWMTRTAIVYTAFGDKVYAGSSKGSLAAQSRGLAFLLDDLQANHDSNATPRKIEQQTWQNAPKISTHILAVRLLMWYKTSTESSRPHGKQYGWGSQSLPAEIVCSAPSLIIPAPHAHTFRSAALTSCGSFFAILISAESAHPAVVICSSLSGEILLRIELRDVRPSVKLPVTWVSTTGTHSLIVPTEENYLLALEFCDGYKRIESKRKLNVDYACGDIEKITPVICGKDGHALAFIYPHAIAVLSYPEGKALVVNRNVRTRAIIRVIQTSSKFVAIGIIETTSSYVRALPTDVVLSTDIVRQLTANPVKGPLSGLAWALIGNSRYSVLAPVPNVTAQGVVAYCNLPSSYCGLGMFSDTGRIMAFDPQKRASVLWEHQLPDDCMRNLRSAALYTATSDYSENSFIILAHPSSFQCRTTETQAVCVHIVGSPLDEPDQKTDTTEVLWPKTVLRPSSFNSEARLHSPAPLNMTPNSATDQIAQKQPSIPLFLRLKPINSREELIATDRADHASSAELLSNGSEAIAQPALIRKALENVTNLGVNRTISRNRRRFQKKKLCSSALAQAEQTVLGLQNHSSEDDNGA